MALSTEIILTLQQLNGVGNKTIFKIARDVKGYISTVGQLCDFWKQLTGKKLKSITDSEIYEAHHKALQIIDDCKQEEVGIISFYDESYPDILRTCRNEKGELDPPVLLYYRGDIDALERPGIAFIGTREPTENGVLAGKYFSSEFAKHGYNIVSGLATGCDTSGHQGALSVGGVTTAFLANGLDWSSIYPKENTIVAKKIVENGGLLLSEYPVGQACGRYGLVARDRLQAGLAYATVIIQTGETGGTMHAVNATIKSHKPLFAVEYRKDSDISHDKVKGNIKLIKEGTALPLRSDCVDNVISMINDFIKQVNNQSIL